MTRTQQQQRPSPSTVALSWWVKRNPMSTSSLQTKLSCIAQNITDIDVSPAVLAVLTVSAPAEVRDTVAEREYCCCTEQHDGTVVEEGTVADGAALLQAHHTHTPPNPSPSRPRKQGGPSGRGCCRFTNLSTSPKLPASTSTPRRAATTGRVCDNQHGLPVAQALLYDTILLSHNRIRDLLGVVQFRNVVRLSLQGNRIRRIEDCASLALLPRLQFLSLEFNPVAQLPHYRAHMLRICAWPDRLTPQCCRLRRLDTVAVTALEIDRAGRWLQREMACMPSLLPRQRLLVVLASVESRLRMHAELRQRGLLPPSREEPVTLDVLMTRCCACVMGVLDSVELQHAARKLMRSTCPKNVPRPALQTLSIYCSSSSSGGGGSNNSDSVCRSREEDETCSTARMDSLEDATRRTRHFVHKTREVQVKKQVIAEYKDECSNYKDRIRTVQNGEVRTKHAMPSASCLDKCAPTTAGAVSFSSSAPAQTTSLRSGVDTHAPFCDWHDDGSGDVSWCPSTVRHVVVAIDVQLCRQLRRIAHELGQCVSAHDVDALYAHWLTSCATVCSPRSRMAPQACAKARGATRQIGPDALTHPIRSASSRRAALPSSPTRMRVSPMRERWAEMESEFVLADGMRARKRAPIACAAAAAAAAAATEEATRAESRGRGLRSLDDTPDDCTRSAIHCTDVSAIPVQEVLSVTSSPSSSSTSVTAQLQPRCVVPVSANAAHGPRACDAGRIHHSRSLPYRCSQSTVAPHTRQLLHMWYRTDNAEELAAVAHGDCDEFRTSSDEDADDAMHVSRLLAFPSEVDMDSTDGGKHNRHGVGHSTGRALRDGHAGAVSGVSRTCARRDGYAHAISLEETRRWLVSRCLWRRWCRVLRQRRRDRLCRELVEHKVRQAVWRPGGVGSLAALRASLAGQQPYTRRKRLYFALWRRRACDAGLVHRLRQCHMLRRWREKCELRQLYQTCMDRRRLLASWALWQRASSASRRRMRTKGGMETPPPSKSPLAARAALDRAKNALNCNTAATGRVCVVSAVDIEDDSASRVSSGAATGVIGGATHTASAVRALKDSPCSGTRNNHTQHEESSRGLSVEECDLTVATPERAPASMAVTAATNMASLPVAVLCAANGAAMAAPKQCNSGDVDGATRVNHITHLAVAASSGVSVKEKAEEEEGEVATDDNAQDDAVGAEAGGGEETVERRSSSAEGWSSTQSRTNREVTNNVGCEEKMSQAKDISKNGCNRSHDSLTSDANHGTSKASSSTSSIVTRTCGLSTAPSQSDSDVAVLKEHIACLHVERDMFIQRIAELQTRVANLTLESVCDGEHRCACAAQAQVAAEAQAAWRRSESEVQRLEQVIASLRQERRELLAHMLQR